MYSIGIVTEMLLPPPVRVSFRISRSSNDLRAISTHHTMTLELILELIAQTMRRWEDSVPSSMQNFRSVNSILPRTRDLVASFARLSDGRLRKKPSSNPPISRRIQQTQGVRLGFGICGDGRIRTPGAIARTLHFE